MKVYTITNQKGGVGKSTIACHLSWYLRDAGRRVLHIDLDPQGNSSKTLGKFATVTMTVRPFFNEADVPLIEPVEGGLTLLPVGADMTEIEREPNRVIGYFAANVELQTDNFDAVVIDTAPTAGVKMSAALFAATDVIAPIELESYSVDGFTSLLRTIKNIEKINPTMNFIGMLPNRFNGVSAAQKQMMEHLLGNYAKYLVPTKIPTRSAISDAIREGMPVWEAKGSSSREAGKELKAALDVVMGRASK